MTGKLSLRRIGLRLLLLILALGPGLSAQAQATDDKNLKAWSVGILAADWRDSEGATIEAFENARRDLTASFATAGFDPAHITNLSLRPNLLTGDTLSTTQAFAAIGAGSSAAPGGCLLYFTSHGSPEGLVMGGEGILNPAQLDGLVDHWCGTRPTVVVVSACFSGGFIPALAAPNRLVMTAARPDRTSFGCAAGATYPVFDGCVLESLPDADDFIHLASLTRRCVSTRENQEGFWPPSEPLTAVGNAVEDFFIFLNFNRPPPQD